MNNWNPCRLNTSLFICGSNSVWIDTFGGTSINSNNWATKLGPTNLALSARLHGNNSEQLFLDQNVTVAGGKCIITMKNDNPSVANTDGDGNVIGSPITRDISSGVIYCKEAFNYGKYEIRSKNPDHAHAWTSFWVWHHQELDIYDVFSNHTLHTAVIDYDTRDSKSFSPSSLGIDPSEMNTYSANWTPYFIDIAVNGNVIHTVYRYYDENGTPLRVDCGDIIPQGLYYENPSFLESNGVFFSPIAWFAVDLNCWNNSCDDTGAPNPFDGQNDCDYDNSPYTSCGPAIDLNDLPLTYEIDYISVEESGFDLIEFSPNCVTFEQCDNEYCFVTINESLNPAMFFNSQFTITSIQPVSNIQSVSGTNCVQLVDDQLEASVNISYTWFNPSTNQFENGQFEYTFNNQENEPTLIVYQNYSDCSIAICVDDPSCIMTEINSSNSTINQILSLNNTDVGQPSGMENTTCEDCFEFECLSECTTIELTYMYCGELESSEYEICPNEPVFSLDQSLLLSSSINYRCVSEINLGTLRVSDCFEVVNSTLFSLPNCYYKLRVSYKYDCGPDLHYKYFVILDNCCQESGEGEWQKIFNFYPNPISSSSQSINADFINSTEVNDYISQNNLDINKFYLEIYNHNGNFLSRHDLIPSSNSIQLSYNFIPNTEIFLVTKNHTTENIIAIENITTI